MATTTKTTKKSTTKRKVKKEENTDITKLQESIEAVNTEIVSDDNIEKINEQIQNDLKPIVELSNEVAEIATKKEELNNLILSSPDKIPDFVKEELKKAQTMQEKGKILMNIIRNGKNQSGMSTSWNGVFGGM